MTASSFKNFVNAAVYVGDAANQRGVIAQNRFLDNDSADLRQRQQTSATMDRNYRSRSRVLIIERQLLHYRVGIYVRKRELLAAQDMELQLLVGSLMVAMRTAPTSSSSCTKTKFSTTCG